MSLRKFVVALIVFSVSFFMGLMANCTILYLFHPHYAAAVGALVAATLVVLWLGTVGCLDKI